MKNPDGVAPKNEFDAYVSMGVEAMFVIPRNNISIPITLPIISFSQPNHSASYISFALIMVPIMMIAIILIILFLLLG